MDEVFEEGSLKESLKTTPGSSPSVCVSGAWRLCLLSLQTGLLNRHSFAALC